VFAGTSMGYDANGNLVSDGVNSYTWNARNQLSSVSGPSTSATFQYDALGRRIVKTIGSVTTRFLYDAQNIVQEQSGGVAISNELTGNLDQIFSRADSNGVVIPLTDALGSTLALSDSNGLIQTRYTYEPFGKAIATGSTSLNSQKYTNREDDGIGLLQYRNRYYSPTFGRFISEDLIGTMNVYSYAANDPINNQDPFGLATVYYWGPTGTSKYGHLAVKLEDGTYISFWPTDTPGCGDCLRRFDGEIHDYATDVREEGGRQGIPYR